MSGPRLVVLAAGGTGGHVFPAEALARELGRRGCRLAMITDQRGGTLRGAPEDLVVHRVLIDAFGLGEGGDAPPHDQLVLVGERISKAERRAQAAERGAMERYVASFLGSAGAVTLVSTLHAGGGFGTVFVALAGVALTALAAAALMPRIGEPAAAPAAASGPA